MTERKTVVKNLHLCPAAVLQFVMSFGKSKKSPVKLVHLEIITLLVAYFLLSNFVFIRSVSLSNLYLSFLIPLTFGILTSCLFLYLFSHQDFFHFITSLEKEEKKQEKKYLTKFIHFGKIITCILISGVGGSILLALAAKFLFSEPEDRYLIVIVSTLISTAFTVSLAKGLLGIIF